MNGKKVEAYQTSNLTLDIRLYECELRKLLKLPVRTGKIVSAEFSSGRLEVKFTSIRKKYFII